MLNVTCDCCAIHDMAQGSSFVAFPLISHGQSHVEKTSVLHGRGASTLLLRFPARVKLDYLSFQAWMKAEILER